MKNEAIKFCNETIYPGEQLTLALPLPEIFSCAPLYMPIKLIHGKQKGPTVLFLAAMHGTEINGTEIINQLLNSSRLKNLHGTLLAIPVINVYGLINRSPSLPGGIDLDTCFPGSSSGSHAGRMADSFVTQILSHVDYCVDLRTGPLNHTNLPQIYCDFRNKESQKLAQIFNAPVITNLIGKPGSLQQYATQKNIPYLMYEAGEAMRFDKHAIKVGMNGLLNILQTLGMISEKKSREIKPLKSFSAQKNIWVHAPTSGISHNVLKLGQMVEAGQLLCTIRDPFGATDSVRVTSPKQAIIVGKNNLPLVHEGESLFQLAVFEEMAKAATQLEEWHHQSNDESTPRT